MNKIFISYNEFKKIYPTISFPKKTIPKILYRTSEFEIDKLPPEIFNVLKKTKEKAVSYIQVYFDPRGRTQFIKDNFPQFLKYYRVLNPGAYRADLLRLLLIYKYGGIYNDIGSTYYLNIGTFIENNDELIITKDYVDYVKPVKYGISNAFIGSHGEHPIIKFFIEWVLRNIQNKYYGVNALDITGPMALGKAFNTFFGNKMNKEIKSGNFIL